LVEVRKKEKQMMCEHCGYRRAMLGLIVCKKCLSEFVGEA